MSGNSASRRAEQLRAEARRGVWRRVLAWLGWNRRARRADAVASRWDLGAAAEATTARMLQDLHRQGWHVLHDRALPGSRANLDHVLVSPCGTTVIVLDTKRWHARRPTWLVRGLVHCGTENRHGQVDAVARYAVRVARVLDLPVRHVVPLLVVHGSPIADGHLEASTGEWPGPVHVLGPDWLVPTLARSPHGRDPRRAQELAAWVERRLPPYVPGG